MPKLALGESLGATLLQAGGARFRVWAPLARSVDVELYTPDGAVRPLRAVGKGFYSEVVPEASAGLRYRFCLDGGSAYPDPASRFQPEGVHGPSEIVDPAAYKWTAEQWAPDPGRALTIYELHVGTFTPIGTFDAVIPELDELRGLGASAIELMPVAEFSWSADEYRLDGLRLDATHAIYDQGPRHLLAEIARVAHDRERLALVFAEDHRNLVTLFNPPERGGFGLDGIWADDFHHALRTYLTPEREGYYRLFGPSRGRRSHDAGRLSLPGPAPGDHGKAARHHGHPTSQPVPSFSAPRTTIRLAIVPSASACRTWWTENATCWHPRSCSWRRRRL